MSNVEFECDRIREYDLKNQLIKAGISWNERTAVIRAYRKYATGYLLAGAAMIGGGIWVKASFRFTEGIDLYLINFGLVCWLVGVVMFFWPARARDLAFTREGQIVEHHWLRGDEMWTTVGTDDIASIGTHPSSTWHVTWTQSVDIVTVHGDTMVIADDLHAYHARKVAVELNNALTEIRAAQAVAKAQARAAAKTAQPRRGLIQ